MIPGDRTNPGGRPPGAPDGPRTDGASTSFAVVHGQDAARAARLLHLGIKGPRRPVDRLVERLRAGDRQRWVEGVVTEIDRAIQPGARDLLLTGSHGAGPALDLLRRIKDRCKQQAARAEPGKEPLEPMLGYFLAVGAALTHHNTRISSVSRAEIDGVLLDLACELSDPWADLLSRATQATAGA